MSVYDKYEQAIMEIDPIKYKGTIKEVIGFLNKKVSDHTLNW